MILLIPYAADVPLDRRPVANWLLLILMTTVFVLQIIALSTEPLVPYEIRGRYWFNAQEVYPPAILTGWDLRRLFGHMWLHGGPIYLAGNLLFLWLFGNAVCSKTGNWFYLVLYLFFGLLSAAMHLLFDSGPAVGAGGAISGIVGMYMVLYPLNEIACVLWRWRFGFYFRTFNVSGFWIIPCWFVISCLLVIVATAGISHYALLGNFVAGAMMAFVLLALGIIKMSEDERSIVCLIKERRQNRLDEKLTAEAHAAVQKAKQEEEST